MLTSYLPNYTLDIISHHPQFANKHLKKYAVDGLETVGAWGDEPFEIKFKNNTWKKVQVKISVDGTDILTAKPADTEVSKDMWVVQGYATLTLKAWPETSNGGAHFVFTSADKGVAAHTHGDLTSRGIIAAAVFVEGHVEPVRLSYDYTDVCKGSSGGSPDGRLGKRRMRSEISDTLGNFSGSMSFDTSTSFNSCSNSGPVDSIYLNDADDAVVDTKGLESLVSVGAGAHVDQKITYVTGLIKPVLSETVRVKYVWWDDLVAKLKETAPADKNPSGFPGDKEHKIMSLGKTPRINTPKEKRVPAPQPVFTRF